MTQPDYDRIAEAINRALHYTMDEQKTPLAEVIKELANEFDNTDIRFNVTRFLNTCLR